ncbi:hypothetical protein IID62_11745, partial [candidate division KSB1 bacterium]|nr:hypothetical protein [candidate division KSB1 bacterium]
MARFSAGVLTAAGTSLRPMMSIYSAAASTGTLREVGCFNTTATAVAVFLTRLTDTGTQGAGQTEARHNMKGPPALGPVFTTHTANVTLGEELGSAVPLHSFGLKDALEQLGEKGYQVQAGEDLEIGGVPTGVWVTEVARSQLRVNALNALLAVINGDRFNVYMFG